MVSTTESGRSYIKRRPNDLNWSVSESGQSWIRKWTLWKFESPKDIILTIRFLITVDFFYLRDSYDRSVWLNRPLSSLWTVRFRPDSENFSLNPFLSKISGSATRHILSTNIQFVILTIVICIYKLFPVNCFCSTQDHICWWFHSFRLNNNNIWLTIYES